jgi:hypothetical protein
MKPSMKHNDLSSILRRTLASTHLRELGALVAIAGKRAVDDSYRLPATPQELDALWSFHREIQEMLARREKI